MWGKWAWQARGFHNWPNLHCTNMEGSSGSNYARKLRQQQWKPRVFFVTWEVEGPRWYMSNLLFFLFIWKVSYFCYYRNFLQLLPSMKFPMNGNWFRPTIFALDSAHVMMFLLVSDVAWRYVCAQITSLVRPTMHYYSIAKSFLETWQKHLWPHLNVAQQIKKHLEREQTNWVQI